MHELNVWIFIKAFYILEQDVLLSYRKMRPTSGQDYISILYNDVCDMGGAHPYSRMDGITIDCKTGEQVLASQLVEKEDEEILKEVSDAMGFDSLGTWEDMDFYLTDSTIVFFYRMPGYWDDVEWNRDE